MRVLLADPPAMMLDASGLTRQVEPLGLAYVASALAAEHDVRLLLPDTRSYTGPDPWAEIASAVAGEAPDVVGITVVTAALPAAARLVELVRGLDRDVRVVLGGAHPTADPLGALNATGADFAVIGEGEDAINELLRALSGGPAASLAGIRGLAWRAPDGLAHANPRRPPIADLDRLARPMRDRLVWPEDIEPPFYQAMLSSRGCNSSCLYCASGLMGRGLRLRSVAGVLDEIAALRSEYGVSHAFFQDSVFTGNRARTLDLCTALARDVEITFDCQTRVDCLDPELLPVMAEGGCRHIMLGIESGDEETLRRIGKPGRLTRTPEVAKQIRRAGIRSTGFFMIGWPWDDAARIQQTADFACSIGLDAVFLFSVTPLPGTRLWEMVSGRAMPASVDFRSPAVNLTSLSDPDYARLF
ncbi:MAG: radical SAM protein, partial [Bacillota bacterium]|nr:radical SAM protein [Bacillota bacterium]